MAPGEHHAAAAVGPCPYQDNPVAYGQSCHKQNTSLGSSLLSAPAVPALVAVTVPPLALLALVKLLPILPLLALMAVWTLMALTETSLSLPVVP